ncbi:MAG: NAD(P)/FAD-dependent oxidoreductase [Anaerolineaceae bacterium]|nr:NAD(P)/FAD-dependent oxidoreductase [Anaerolineaceae bacterium]MBN2676639.1 NAD(P)/FAD-dependent oxidoreductase [Anaerolineaceae bacterium]
MKTFLILGAGTAGTLMAHTMTKKLDPHDWQVIVVDRDEKHYYQAGYIFIPFGMYKPESVIKDKKSFLPKKVKVIWSDIHMIEPDKNQVTLVRDKQVIHYDELVVATGVDIRPDQTEGMLGGGWQKNIFDFYTFDGSVKLAQALKDFKGGNLVINVTEMPVKCPVAPLEFVFLADWYLRKRGLRAKTELIYSTPLPDAFTKPSANAKLSDMFRKRDIHLEAEYAIGSVDAARNMISSYDGREIAYDLLVTVPTNMGIEAIERSGIGDDLNYIQVDKGTLQSRRWPNVWAVGDTNNILASKAGSVAHFQHEVVAKNILDHIAGKSLEEQFDGHSLCFIESGYGKAVLIDFNYDQEPVEGTYPLPGLGPFRLLNETYLNHWGKLVFKEMYWAMMYGIKVPLPSKMSTAGKKISSHNRQGEAA